MPRVGKVKGASVVIYGREHNPPHVHARAAGRESVIRIRDQRLLWSDLPGAVERRAKAWVKDHEKALQKIWDDLQAGRPIEPIDD